MHVITECPRCKNDFMYHSSDTHLVRSNMPINSGSLGLNDEDLEEHDFEFVICQDCDYVETWAKDSLERYYISNYQEYLVRVNEMWESGELNELSEAGFLAIDSREYREDGSLSKEVNRVLTEIEFNARFLN